jgi:hypothetical protein
MSGFWKNGFASITRVPVTLSGTLAGDSRPWTRQQIVQYLHRDLNFPGHEVVIKRMCKHFFTVGDHELLAHFHGRIRSNGSPQTDSSFKLESATSGSLSRRKTVHCKIQQDYSKRNRANRRNGALVSIKSTVYASRSSSTSPANRLFSHRTRNHLRRRSLAVLPLAQLPRCRCLRILR